MKICIACKKDKPIEEFSIKRGKATGKCRDCHNDYQRQYYALPGNTEKQRQRVTAHRATGLPKAQKYNISVEEMQRYLSGMCNLCGLKQAVVIDHDHDTGTVRGGLCGTCNVGLGMFSDNIEGLERAIEYLRAGSIKVNVPIL
jgi:hypothetical protein